MFAPEDTSTGPALEEVTESEAPELHMALGDEGRETPDSGTDGCSTDSSKGWRSYRFLLVSTAGATRTSPHRFFLAGDNMTVAQLVNIKYKIMQGWREWFSHATFRPMQGKLSPTMKSDVILVEDLRVRMVVGACNGMWTILGAEGEEYGDCCDSNAMVLLDDKDAAFTACTSID